MFDTILPYGFLATVTAILASNVLRGAIITTNGLVAVYYLAGLDYTGADIQSLLQLRDAYDFLIGEALDVIALTQALLAQELPAAVANHMIENIANLEFIVDVLVGHRDIIFNLIYPLV